MAIQSNDTAIKILECFGIDSKDVISVDIHFEVDDVVTITVKKFLSQPNTEKLRITTKRYCLAEKKLLFPKSKE
jgi:hypothetical protein